MGSLRANDRPGDLETESSDAIVPGAISCTITNRVRRSFPKGFSIAVLRFAFLVHACYHSWQIPLTSCPCGLAQEACFVFASNMTKESASPRAVADISREPERYVPRCSTTDHGPSGPW